jgi:hypothetical protein
VRRITRLALAAACATTLATPAIAQGIETTLRVEGSAGTTIQQSPQDVAAAGNTVVTDPTDGDTITVPSRSATAQLVAAAGNRAVPFAFDIFDFGSGPTSFVNRIGPDTQPSDFSEFWLFKVNHVASPVGADEALLSAGDEVLWFYGPATVEAELDVTAPSEPVKQGETFTVNVESYDAGGVSTPAAGVTVAYAGSSASTNEAGAATLTASGGGTQAIVATAPNSVRDSANVCGYPATDPGVCGRGAVSSGPAGAGTTPNPVCRDISSSEATPGAGSTPKPTDATYRQIQWYARVTMERVRQMTEWLDGGIESGDVCGGSIAQSAFVGGISFADGGPTNLANAPSPRPISFEPPAAPQGGTADRAGGAHARATRTIAIEALKRVNGLAARARGGLTGGDLEDGAIGPRELAPGARVVSAPRGATGAAASSAPTAGPTRVSAFVPTGASAAKDLRVARAGLIRSSRLFQDLRSGLGPDAFAARSLGTEDLSVSVRP